MNATPSSTITPNSTKQSGLAGCLLSIAAIALAFLGIYELALGSVIAIIFSSARMFSFASIAIVFIIACTCFLYFLLAFRIKRQNWIISLGLLAVVWLVLPLSLRFSINAATARVRINGNAMGTTLPDGSYVLADRQAYQHADPQRGDLVIFQIPTSPNSDLLKRIIGLPGENVSIKQGQVSINGTPIEEPYVTTKATYEGEWNIPEGMYFVLGDNRPDSSDSHSWGFVPRGNIIAKAVWVYFPLSSFGKIGSPNFGP